jgi:phosphatidylserine decarboxylase
MISDAYRFVVPLLAVAAGFAYWHFPIAATILVLAAGFVFFFFRNPRRVIPAGNNIIVSPADGKIVKISQIPVEGETKGGHQISIFLSIFDVHVNRSPIDGAVERFQYKRGKFKVAFDDEASRVNEQNIITICGQGIQIIVKQVAGLIARRVVCWKQPGNVLHRGELIGLIRFGSRVDVILPDNVKILVRIGDRVKGGSSILGECL